MFRAQPQQAAVAVETCHVNAVAVGEVDVCLAAVSSVAAAGEIASEDGQRVVYAWIAEGALHEGEQFGSGCPRHGGA